VLTAGQCGITNNPGEAFDFSGNNIGNGFFEINGGR
jgi:hypothetical protein